MPGPGSEFGVRRSGGRVPSSEARGPPCHRGLGFDLLARWAGKWSPGLGAWDTSSHQAFQCRSAINRPSEAKTGTDIIQIYFKLSYFMLDGLMRAHQEHHLALYLRHVQAAGVRSIRETDSNETGGADSGGALPG